MTTTTIARAQGSKRESSELFIQMDTGGGNSVRSHNYSNLCYSIEKLSLCTPQ